MKPRIPIDPVIAQLLRSVDQIAREAACPYFVAGATARDLVLVHVHGLPPGRATRDVDFGVAVENWQQFAKLKEYAQTNGVFRAHPRAMQRLLFTGGGAGVELPVDLIPFRGGSSSDYMIEWPPDRDIVLNVAGFEEAFASSLSLRVEEGFNIRVASIPGLALLKLVAWLDRRHSTSKDAADVQRLITAYGDAAADRLYDQELPLLEEHEFDTQSAGAELLGRDIAGLSARSTRGAISQLAKESATFDRLLDHILQSSAMPETVEAAERLLRAFRKGLASTLAGA